MRLWLSLVFASLLLIPARSAEALCIYRGVDNARTSLGQEYADARWVVRVRVVGATDGEVEAGKPDAGMPWTLYQLDVTRSYKGDALRRMRLFTMRDSGGFYMDRPGLPLPQGHDIGGEYLLFLNPIPPYQGQSRSERGAAFVNYACGQSRPWREIPAASRRLLASLSMRR
jgi:hypothetical protein